MFMSGVKSDVQNFQLKQHLTKRFGDEVKFVRGSLLIEPEILKAWAETSKLVDSSARSFTGAAAGTSPILNKLLVPYRNR